MHCALNRLVSGVTINPENILGPEIAQFEVAGSQLLGAIENGSWAMISFRPQSHEKPDASRLAQNLAATVLCAGGAFPANRPFLSGTIASDFIVLGLAAIEQAPSLSETLL